MLKYGQHQSIKASKLRNSELYDAIILSDINNSLIITKPIIKKNNKIKYIEYLEPKSNIYIKYEYQGNIYLFRTYVIKSSFTPFPHIILKYPEKSNLQIKKLREFDRYECILPLQVENINKEYNISYEDVYSVDISKSGIGIIAKENLPETFLVSFNISLENITLLCEQKIQKSFYYDNYHFFGCKINKIRNKKLFTDYINTLTFVRNTK